MFCKFCGKEIPDDAAFCPHCGGRLKESTDTNDVHRNETPKPSEYTNSYVPRGNTGSNNNIGLAGFVVSVVSLVFTFISMFFFWYFFGIVGFIAAVAGLVLGIMGYRGRNNYTNYSGLTTAGFVCGIIAVVYAFIILIIFLV